MEGLRGAHTSLAQCPHFPGPDSTPPGPDSTPPGPVITPRPSPPRFRVKPRPLRGHPSEGRPEEWPEWCRVGVTPCTESPQRSFSRDFVGFRPQRPPESAPPGASGRRRAVSESSYVAPMHAASLTKGYGGNPLGPVRLPHGPARFSCPPVPRRAPARPAPCARPSRAVRPPVPRRAPAVPRGPLARVAACRTSIRHRLPRSLPAPQLPTGSPPVLRPTASPRTDTPAPSLRTASLPTPSPSTPSPSTPAPVR